MGCLNPFISGSRRWDNCFYWPMEPDYMWLFKGYCREHLYTSSQHPLGRPWSLISKQTCHLRRSLRHRYSATSTRSSCHPCLVCKGLSCFWHCQILPSRFTREPFHKIRKFPTWLLPCVPLSLNNSQVDFSYLLRCWIVDWTALSWVIDLMCILNRGIEKDRFWWHSAPAVDSCGIVINFALRAFKQEPRVMVIQVFLTPFFHCS